jgi:hypothetical protein
MTIAAALLTITIRVYDIYGLPAAERHEAIETAGRIMPRLESRRSSSSASRRSRGLRGDPEARELVLRVSPDAPPRHSVLGTAVVSPNGGPSVMATVYGNAVLEGAARTASASGRWPAASRRTRSGTCCSAPTATRCTADASKWDVTRAGADDWLFARVDADTIRHNLAVRAATRSAAAIGGDSFEELGD